MKNISFLKLVSFCKSLRFSFRDIKKYHLQHVPVRRPPVVSNSELTNSQNPITIPKKIKRNFELKKVALKEIQHEINPKLSELFTYLPQTQNYREIIDYFNKFRKILKAPQYLIILSRLAHLKNIKSYKLDPQLDEIIEEVCKLNLKSSPKYISNFIKYCAIIGIHDKLLWRKLISELYKTDFQKSLTEFCLTLNYLQVHGILNKKIISFMQDKSMDMLQRNVDNQSFKAMELLLNSLKNFRIKPELMEVIQKRLGMHIYFMPLKNLRNAFIPAVQMKLESEDLWDSFHKWIYLRMEDSKKKKESETIKENFSYLFFTYSKMADENICNMKEKFVSKQYENLFKLFYDLFDEYQENLFYGNKSSHFIRIFKAFSILLVNYANEIDKRYLSFMFEYLLKNEELKEKMKILEFNEIFACIGRIQTIYHPFKNHQKLIILLKERLLSQSFELPILEFLKICEFFFEEKEELAKNEEIGLEEMEKIFEILKEVLSSFIKLRIFTKDQDFITLEQVIASFQKNGIISEKEGSFLVSQIKR